MTGEDVVKGKPDPFVYQEAARRLGVNPKNCLVFEGYSGGHPGGTFCRHDGMRCTG